MDIVKQRDGGLISKLKLSINGDTAPSSLSSVAALETNCGLDLELLVYFSY